MRNPNSAESSGPISAVPVSLYREICDELREKSGQVETLQLNNQRILQENQQLRQEIQRLVQMVMHTHHQVTQISEFQTEPTANGTETFHPRSGLKRSTVPAVQPYAQPSPQRPTVLSRTQMPARTAIAASTMVPFSTTNNPQDWITGTQEPFAQRLFNQTSAITKDLRGWKLAIVISLIILSAFGAGFLVVRPLIGQSHSK
jgi:hypothetical protein